MINNLDTMRIDYRSARERREAGFLEPVRIERASSVTASGVWQSINENENGLPRNYDAIPRNDGVRPSVTASGAWQSIRKTGCHAVLDTASPNHTPPVDKSTGTPLVKGNFKDKMQHSPFVKGWHSVGMTGYTKLTRGFISILIAIFFATTFSANAQLTDVYVTEPTAGTFAYHDAPSGAGNVVDITATGEYKLIFDDAITEIPVNGFQNNQNIVEIVAPDVTTIGQWAFFGNIIQLYTKSL